LRVHLAPTPRFPANSRWPATCQGIGHEGSGQRVVYILRSERDPARHYVGRSANVEERLRWHNEGPSGHTVHHRPWRVLVSIEFCDGGSAARFERYLKSGSGRAFAKRHFGGA
jgi:predicted GIY-YIG superfamily endonuclease